LFFAASVAYPNDLDIRLTPQWHIGDSFVLEFLHNVEDSHLSDSNRSRTIVILVDILGMNNTSTAIGWTERDLMRASRGDYAELPRALKGVEDFQFKFLLDHNSGELTLENGAEIRAEFAGALNSNAIVGDSTIPFALPGWPPSRRIENAIASIVSDARNYFAFENMTFGTSQASFKRSVQLSTGQGILPLTEVIKGTERITLSMDDYDLKATARLSKTYDAESLNAVIGELARRASRPQLASAQDGSNDAESGAEMTSELRADFNNFLEVGYPDRLESVDRIRLANGWTRTETKQFRLVLR
jgi:hypothetical protein